MGPFNPAVIALFIPILIFSIPIIAILTAHQRKMAELFAQQNQIGNSPELAEVRRDLAELKSLVHQQSIAIDNLLTQRSSAAVTERLSPPTQPTL